MENPFEIIHERLTKIESLILDLKENFNSKQDEKLLSPKETCALFSPKISIPTLSRWTSNGLLNRYDIGGRVFYKYSEIIKSLSLKKYFKP